jgi:hypothetical protein
MGTTAMPWSAAVAASSAAELSVTMTTVTVPPDPAGEP